MLPKEQIDRINALARKAKSEGLTDEEKEEQAALRKAYLDAFRTQFRQMMEQIEFVDEETVATREEKQFS